MSAEPVHLTNATPFDLVSEDASAWLDEARNYADGQPVTTQGQADDVSRIMEGLRNAARAADEARKAENRPHDEARAAVQEKYAPLFAAPKNTRPGRVYVALDALEAVLAPYLTRLDDEKREAEAKARALAQAKAEEARQALSAAAAGDLEAREAAEAKAEEAARAARDAVRAGSDKAHARGGARAVGLRTRWVAQITDAQAAARHYWRINPDAFNALLQKLADGDVRSGKRSIPGFDVREERGL